MTDAPVIVYLVRHGRTELNAAGVLRGRLDFPLDDVGRLEAIALGDVFRRLPLTAVVSSPLQRAVQTAQSISDATGARLFEDEMLLDRDYGSWAGRPAAVAIARFGSLDEADGVEPAGAFSIRVSTAVCAAAERWAPGPVALVAHDAVNRYALATLEPSFGDPDAISQRTGCWNRLEKRGSLWSVPVIDAVPYDGHRP